MAAPQQQKNHDIPLGSATCMSEEYAQIIRPFHQESTSPAAIEQVCEAGADPDIL